MHRPSFVSDHLACISILPGFSQQYNKRVPLCLPPFYSLQRSHTARQRATPRALHILRTQIFGICNTRNKGHRIFHHATFIDRWNGFLMRRRTVIIRVKSSQREYFLILTYHRRSLQPVCLVVNLTRNRQLLLKEERIQICKRTMQNTMLR